MPLYVKGTDIEVTGTLDRLEAVAPARGFKDGEPDWMGEAKVDWNSQTTIFRDGQRVWVDENGDTHLEDQIEERPE